MEQDLKEKVQEQEGKWETAKKQNQQPDRAEETDKAEEEDLENQPTTK